MFSSKDITHNLDATSFGLGCLRRDLRQRPCHRIVEDLLLGFSHGRVLQGVLQLCCSRTPWAIFQTWDLVMMASWRPGCRAEEAPKMTHTHTLQWLPLQHGGRSEPLLFNRPFFVLGLTGEKLGLPETRSLIFMIWSSPQIQGSTGYLFEPLV